MFDFAVYLYEYARYTNINVQLKYPFFVGGSNDSDIDFLASRGEATNGVLKEAILTLHSAFPAKMFCALMRMCNMHARAPVFRLRPLATTLDLAVQHQ